MNVAVNVAAPVIVAALVNGNDAVAVIDAVNERSIEVLAVASRTRGHLPKGNADLADQRRRAAQSIPQNIAEGCGRTTRADKAKHYTIAGGTAMEFASHLDVMKLDDP